MIKIDDSQVEVVNNINKHKLLHQCPETIRTYHMVKGGKQERQITIPEQTSSTTCDWKKM